MAVDDVRGNRVRTPTSKTNKNISTKMEPGQANDAFRQDNPDRGDAYSSAEELSHLNYQPNVSVQELANLLQQPTKFRPDRLIHGRKKFSDDQPTTAFPGYLRTLELEVFRPELTDGQKLELLRASVTGEHAETLAEALEDAAVTFATHYPATNSSHYTMKSPVKCICGRPFYQRHL